MYTHTRLIRLSRTGVNLQSRRAKGLHFTCVPPQSLSQAPVWSKAPAVPLVNIRYNPIGCLDHLNRVSAEQLPLVFNELTPEATVGPDDGTTSFNPGMGFCQRHSMVLHEIRQAERGWAAHPGCTVHQHCASFSSHAVNLISHTVEVQGDGGVRHVCQRDLYILHVWPVEVGELNGGIDHTGDAFRQKQATVGCHVPSAEEKVWGDLCNTPQQAAILWQQPRHSSWHHGATMVVMVVVEEALAAGTHWGIKWESNT